MINPLLQRQLQATGLTAEALPANYGAWLDFLARLSLDYDSLCQSSDTELEQRLRETLLLNRALAATSSALEPTAILTILCEELARAFDVPQAAATLLSEDGADLIVVAEYCAPGRPSAAGVVIPVANNEASQYVLAQRKPLVVRDAGAAAMPRRGGLSARVAASTVSLRTAGGLGAGARIEVALRTREGYDLGGMDRGLIRHPVFDTGAWVAQAVPAKAFSNAFDRGAPKVRRALEREIDRALDEIMET